MISLTFIHWQVIVGQGICKADIVCACICLNVPARPFGICQDTPAPCMCARMGLFWPECAALLYLP